MVVSLLCASLLVAGSALAQDDARMKQLRLLCARLSGDLTEPGGMAAFRRCLTTKNPLGEIRRDNNIGNVVATPPDRPDAVPPAGFGRYSRRQLADGVEKFQTVDGNLFFAIDRDGKLWRWMADEKKPGVVAEAIAAFSVLGNGTLFLLGKDGTLQRDSAGQSALIDRNVAVFQAVDSNSVYVLSADSRLWRINAGTRALVDQAVTGFQAIDGSVVYVLGSDRKLWRETGDSSKRAEVAKSAVGFQIVAGSNAVYVLAEDSTLWRQVGTEKAEQVDNSVAGFQAIDMHLVFVLGKDGRLWRELGARKQAVLVDGPLLVGAAGAAFHASDAQHIYLIGNDHKLWAETMPAGR
jgi:hypothetical protein